MNYAIEALKNRRDELVNGFGSLSEQRKNIAALVERLEQAESELADSELALEQVADALVALGVSA